ncbi:hypothetical protein OAH80_03515 [Acidimicrobiia bacterium]|nr:hypothetical protein [Acidimicrobiia bacterium]
MLRKAATVRYFSNSVGTLFTIANLLVITYLLDIYQFALWGVANSLVYIFCSFGQLTYVQYIEKYFPTYSVDKMNYYLYKFLKTIFLLIVVWLSILYFLKYTGYFNKFNAENMHILFLIISFLTFIESSIELVSKYLLALKKTQNYDLNELFIFKIFRLGLFYLLLINGYSVYYLLLTNLLLRGLLLTRILNYDSKGLISIFYQILNSKVKVDNFNNLSYTATAFSIKTLQVTFLNVIFILFSIFVDNETIASYSLGILIINNLKPVFASLSVLLAPIISKNIGRKKNNQSLFNLVSNINKITIAIVTIISIYVTKNKFLISYFLDSFDDSIYNIILISVFASSIASLYIPVYLKNLFDDNEKKLLRVISFNYVLCLIAYTIFQNLYEVNIIYVYLLFEILNLFLILYFFREKKSSADFSYSFYPVITYMAANLFGLNINIAIFWLCIFLIIVDIIKFINIFKIFIKEKDIDYET